MRSGVGDLAALVRALGRGLRAFHEAVGEEWCPFRFDLARALAHVEDRVRSGDISPGGFHHEHAHLTPTAALAELETLAPPDEDLVVCHGDFCPPNMLLQQGRVTGFVDLGELGAADRWWDVAVGAWSVGWNFGEDLETLSTRATALKRTRDASDSSGCSTTWSPDPPRQPGDGRGRRRRRTSAP